MIENLTPEQEARLPEYVERYTALGLTTKKINLLEATKIANEIKKNILDQNECPAVLLPDPYTAWLAVSLFSYESEDVARNNTGEYDAVNLKDIDFVLLCLEEQLGPNSPLYKVALNNKFAALNDGVPNFVWPEIDGNFYAGFFSFYDYMEKELKIEMPQEYHVFRKSLDIALMYPLDNITILCDRPREIHTNNDGDLHNENGPAISYDKGLELYALNGTDMTGSEFVIIEKELNATKILAIENAEQRMQAIKLKGIEKFIDSLEPTIIDELEEYQLLKIRLENKETCYLKMVNPSSGEIHIEGVEFCSTVKDALKWKLGLEDYSAPLAKA